MTISENRSTICKMICKVFEQGEKVRNQDLIFPEEIQKITNIQYGKDRDINRLDIYRRKDQTDKILPVIVNVHGGGWIYGNKEGYQYYLAEFAKRGYAVINFDYHLAPQYKFPKPIEDTFEVFEWLGKHAGEYMLDSAQIYAIGDSAGAHTLSAYITAYYNPAYRRAIQMEYRPWKRNICPKAIALNCGVMSVMREAMSDEFIGILMQEYLKKSEDIEVFNFVPYIKKFSSVYFMEAEGDFTNLTHASFIRKLRENRDVIEVHRYGEKDRELVHCFQCDIRNEEAKKCNYDEFMFFEKEKNS